MKNDSSRSNADEYSVNYLYRDRDRYCVRIKPGKAKFNVCIGLLGREGSHVDES